MKKVVFVGLSNKKYKEPFDITTNSGKIIKKIIDKLEYKCFKLNLVSFAPLNELGKLRYPTKKEIEDNFPYFKQQLDIIKPDCIVGLGRIVNKELLKINEYQKILVTAYHPSYIYVYKKRELEVYINNLITEINIKIGVNND